MRYLKGTPIIGILFKKHGHILKFSLMLGWAGSTADRRFTFDHLFCRKESSYLANPKKVWWLEVVLKQSLGVSPWNL